MKQKIYIYICLFIEAKELEVGVFFPTSNNLSIFTPHSIKIIDTPKRHILSITEIMNM